MKQKISEDIDAAVTDMAASCSAELTGTGQWVRYKNGVTELKVGDIICFLVDDPEHEILSIAGDVLYVLNLKTTNKYNLLKRRVWMVKVKS